MCRGGNYMVCLILLTAAAPGCRKPYAPGPLSTPGTYLVVEGVIDPGTDSTIIKLSNTVRLSAPTSQAMETNARLTVENEAGTSYSLTEFKAGQYLAVGLNLDKAKKYRLHIKTSGGNEYASDYVPVKKTPPVDSVTYKITPKGLQINSNTHDATNSTRYYRMAYEETWKYHARYNSELIIKNGEIVSRREDEQIYYCYRGDKSSNIILASSEKLTQDVIFERPIILIPPSSEKLTLKYSILLKQYALTKEAYEFWENIRKIRNSLAASSMRNHHN
jgi:hypothetical protein